MDGLCGSHGRRLAYACAFALIALLALGGAAGHSHAAWHLPLEEDEPELYSPIGTAPSNVPLTYHGGSVMHTNKVYAIYWVPPGQSVSANYKSIIDGYFTNVAADSGTTTNLYATSAEYTDGGGAAAYNTRFNGSIVDTQPFPSSGCTNTNPATGSAFPVCLTDAQITAEIDRVGVAQNWVRDGSAIYFMFTPKNVGTCMSGTTCFATYFCAYHSAFGNGHGTFVYANMPYDASTSTCGLGGVAQPNGDDADLTLNVTSHEHMEAITDPYGNAWFDSGGNENGDRCAWTFGSSLGGSGSTAWNQAIGSGHYMLQLEWSNATSSCVGNEPSAPVNSVAPSISGSTTVGSTLTVANGTWTNSPTSYQYAWQRCTPTCAGITGAKSQTYTLVQADSGATIKALVWALNAGGHGAAWTAASAAVTAGTVPANTVAPSVSGTTTVGSTLTVDPGTWTNGPTSYQYTWRRCTPTCAGISGANGSTYVLQPGDAGATIQVLVWAVNGSGHGAATTSQTATVTAPAAVPANTVAPSVSGTTTVGSTLTVNAGTWTNGPTSYQYTWRRCTPTCAGITGANGSTYVLQQADAGATIQVLVWAVNASGHGAATTSQTATVTAPGAVPANTVAPAVTGTLTVGSTLTVSTGTWTNSPTSYQFTWRRCAPTCTGISGANGSTYVLQPGDAGATFQVLVWAVNAAGHGAVTTSQTGTVH
jgi:hypothetical protein